MPQSGVTRRKGSNVVKKSGAAPPPKYDDYIKKVEQLDVPDDIKQRTINALMEAKENKKLTISTQLVMDLKNAAIKI